jgi:ferric-dicitrate binding protein FerR (iron transport regulator)
MTPVPELPPELDAELATRSDADELRATWRALSPEALVADEATLSEEDRAARTLAWQRIQSRLNSPRVLPLRRARSTAWRIAAALILTVVGAGGAMWWWPSTIAAPAGAAPVQVSLADGSQLVLAPGSRVRVSQALGALSRLGVGERRVTLEGEAFFAVQRDGRPFVVRTSDADVRVLGTRFDVRSPLAGVGTRVAVEEGRVRVTPAAASGSDAAPILGAGDVANVRAGAAKVLRTGGVSAIAAWRSGGFAALDEPLGAVLADIARQAGVEISTDIGSVADVMVSAFYPTARDVATMLADLCTVHGLVFERTSRGFHVSRGTDPR